MRGLPAGAARSRRPPWTIARPPRRRPGASARPGITAAGAGAPERLPERYRAERQAIPDSAPTDRARSLAVSCALRMLERQHRHRYKELYQQQFRRARSQPHPRRPGRPPGVPDQLPSHRRPSRHGSEMARAAVRHVSRGRGRGSEPDCKRSGNAPPSCSPKGCRRRRSPTGSESPGRQRLSGGPVGEPVVRRRCEAVAPAAIPRFPTANCPRSNGRCCRGRSPTGLRVMLGPSSGLGSWASD